MKVPVPLLLLLCLPGLALPAGCVSLGGSQSKEEQMLSRQYDDAGIKTAVASALLSKNPTKANDVEVHCFRGNIFLVGEADPEFRRFALAAAREIKGVETVTSHWFPAGTAATAADTALKAAIAEKMRSLAISPLSQINIDVWGGQVVLTGILPDALGVSQALAAAKSAAGVKNVTSYLATD
jgi:osmotically-inducible protein OsmY